MRHERGPHLRMWAWCSSRSRRAVKAAASPRSLTQSARVAGLEIVVVHQVLPDRHRVTAALGQRRGDVLAKRLASARARSATRAEPTAQGRQIRWALRRIWPGLGAPSSVDSPVPVAGFGPGSVDAPAVVAGFGGARTRLSPPRPRPATPSRHQIPARGLSSGPRIRGMRPTCRSTVRRRRIRRVSRTIGGSLDIRSKALTKLRMGAVAPLLSWGPLAPEPIRARSRRVPDTAPRGNPRAERGTRVLRPLLRAVRSLLFVLTWFHRLVLFAGAIGHAGVDMFFLLSGFLIYGIILHKIQGLLAVSSATDHPDLPDVPRHVCCLCRGVLRRAQSLEDSLLI